MTSALAQTELTMMDPATRRRTLAAETQLVRAQSLVFKARSKAKIARDQSAPLPNGAKYIGLADVMTILKAAGRPLDYPGCPTGQVPIDQVATAINAVKADPRCLLNGIKASGGAPAAPPDPTAALRAKLDDLGVDYPPDASLVALATLVDEHTSLSDDDDPLDDAHTADPLASTANTPDPADDAPAPAVDWTSLRSPRQMSKADLATELKSLHNLEVSDSLKHAELVAIVTEEREKVRLQQDAANPVA